MHHSPMCPPGSHTLEHLGHMSQWSMSFIKMPLAYVPRHFCGRTDVCKYNDGIDDGNFCHRTNEIVYFALRPLLLLLNADKEI